MKKPKTERPLNIVQTAWRWSLYPASIYLLKVNKRNTKTGCVVFFLFLFSIMVFFHRHWRFTGQQRKGGDHLLFLYTTSTRSQTLRHLFANLHVRWLSRIFNRNTCVYQTSTRRDSAPYQIIIWLMDWWCNVCLLTWWMDSRFLLQQFDMGNRWIWTRIKYHPCNYKQTD